MSDSPVALPDDTNALVAQMYELAINVSAYDALITLSDALVCRTEEAMDGGAATYVQIDTHARRADAILSRLGAEAQSVSPKAVADAVQAEQYPIIILSSDAQVLGVNRAFDDVLGRFTTMSDLQAFLKDASFPGEWNKMQKALAVAQPKNRHVLGALQMETPDHENRMLFILYQAHCPEDPRVCAVLCGMPTTINVDAGATLKRHFSLTDAEFDIVKHLLGGESAQSIAEARRTSLQTVRTQIKSLLSKTGFGSQTELIRQLGALRTAPNVANAASNSPTAPNLHRASGIKTLMQSVQLASGARLDYGLIGPEDGKPVLFVHGLVDSLTMNSRVHALLHERRIRLLAPVRPHFGSSSGYAPHDIPGEACADRTVELLDRLGIKTPVPVIGHMAGAYYAYRLSIRHPTRVSRIVSVAGAVPMAQAWQFERMSKGHRIAGLTARRAPALLRLLTRGGIALLRRNREDFMLRLAFHDSPIDLAFAETEEMRRLIFDRFHFLSAQGHRAFEVDIKIVSSDWSPLSKELQKPISLVHGAHDSVVLHQGVEIFANQIGAQLSTCSDSGQLAWSQSPHLVLDSLDEGALLETMSKPVSASQC